MCEIKLVASQHVSREFQLQVVTCSKSEGLQFFQGTQERRLIERIYRFDGWYVGVKGHGNGMCRLWVDTCMTVFVGQEMVNFPAPQKPDPKRLGNKFYF